MLGTSGTSFVRSDDEETGIVRARDQVLARYPDAVVFMSGSTCLWELHSKLRSQTHWNGFIVWNCKTKGQAWKEGLEYLDRELLKKLES